MHKQEPTDKLPNADWLEAGFGLGSGWVRAGFGSGSGRIACCLPCCRFPLLNQERIQGPENASIARFDGLGCYQTSSEINGAQAGLEHAISVPGWRPALPLRKHRMRACKC